MKSHRQECGGRQRLRCRIDPAGRMQSGAFVHGFARLLLIAGLLSVSTAADAQDSRARRAAQSKPEAGDADIYQFFRDRNIPFDAGLTHRAALEAIVKAADPRAVLIPADGTNTPGSNAVSSVSEEWTGGLCYLKPGVIRPGTGSNTVGKLTGWQEAGKSGVVIDLRGTAGGDAVSVDQISGLFAGTNELYKVKDGAGKVLEIHSGMKQPESRYRLWTVLLADRGTVELAELLVAVLKGRSGVTVVGNCTAGDGRIREVVRFASGDSARIGTKFVELTGGAAALTNGVVPDVQVAASDADKVAPAAAHWSFRQPSEKAKRDRELGERIGNDAVLRRAVDVLIGVKALGIRESSTNSPAESVQ